MYSAPPIREPASGDGLTADWARAIVRALRSMRLSGGPGVRVSSTPSGTTVSLANAGGWVPQEVMVATLPKISGAPLDAPVRPLTDLSGAAVTARVWALDLAMEEGPTGKYDCVAFPVSRVVAQAVSEDGEE